MLRILRLYIIIGLLFIVYHSIPKVPVAAAAWGKLPVLLFRDRRTCCIYPCLFHLRSGGKNAICTGFSQ